MATSSFLALVTPTDRRVPGWLAEALQFADAAGDKSKQMNTLTTLTWHHFFRSFCGSPREMADAEGFARRLAELAEELGTNELGLHGWGLSAVMARYTGRLDEASEHVAALRRVSGKVRHGDPWLAWAASFAVTVAGGAVSAAPPFPPESSSDPVAGVARLIIETELTVAGRWAEVLPHLDTAPHSELGPIGEMAGLLNGVALQLAGRSDEARPWVEKAAAAAQALDAWPAAIGAAAVMAEITGDLSGLPLETSPGAAGWGARRRPQRAARPPRLCLGRGRRGRRPAPPVEQGAGHAGVGDTAVAGRGPVGAGGRNRERRTRAERPFGRESGLIATKISTELPF